MDITTGLSIIVGIYFWFFFIDRFLKSCSHYAYLQFLNGTGLDIKLLRFNWTTTAFNRTFHDWEYKLKFLNAWFNIGLVASLIVLPISIILLIVGFFENVLPTQNGDDYSIIIEPVLPGINLPASEIGYYSATLLICSVIHEIGHALSAAHDDVNIISVGANVFFILPIAYVNISTEKLFSLNPWRQLKIFCAGIWHNLVTALLSYLLLMSIPLLFSPIYFSNQGVIITEITSKSPLLGAKGLSQSDIITEIHDCTVLNTDSWYDCLLILQKNKPSYCINADIVHNLDESIPLKHLDNGLMECCHKENEGKLCFEYLDGKDSILEFPPYVCLPARVVVEQSSNYCTHYPHTCPKDTYCFRPVLANYTNLFKIKRTKKKDVIYIGLANDLYQTFTISSFIPKYSFLNTIVPDVIVKFLVYVTTFSVGLAILNVLPCLFMDGQYITNIICYVLLNKHLRKSHINIISAIITTFFTILLIIHCLLIGWKRLFM